MQEEGHAMANIKEEQIKNDLFQIYLIFTLIFNLILIICSLKFQNYFIKKYLLIKKFSFQIIINILS